MNILVNASQLSCGGGLQVADSVCRELHKFPQHHFYVVLSDHLKDTAEAICHQKNVSVNMFTLSFSGNSLMRKLNFTFRGRVPFLDKMVEQFKIDVVLTIFGPSIWKPRCKHVCGFARPQLVLGDSPYYQGQRLFRRLKTELIHSCYKYAFSSSSKVYYTENPYISQKFKSLIPSAKVYTVTNYYNNVFDNHVAWDTSVNLPPFKGFTLLTVSANYPHKNLRIIIPVIKDLLHRHPDCPIRFVLTLRKEEFPCDEEVARHIVFLGRVDISQVPHLYEQSNGMFLPTMLECFSASYVEAFRMKVPVLTSDLGFAHSLCGDAAVYFDPLSPEDIADAIFKVASDRQLVGRLVQNGIEQLSKFDNYVTRARKLVSILEEVVDKK